MKSIAKGIYDPTKQKKATDDGEQLKKYAKSADVPVSKQDASGFLSYAGKMEDLLEDFLVQLSDVPDEL